MEIWYGYVFCGEKTDGDVRISKFRNYELLIPFVTSLTPIFTQNYPKFTENTIKYHKTIVLTSNLVWVWCFVISVSTDNKTLNLYSIWAKIYGKMTKLSILTDMTKRH